MQRHVIILFSSFLRLVIFQNQHFHWYFFQILRIFIVCPRSAKITPFYWSTQNKIFEKDSVNEKDALQWWVSGEIALFRKALAIQEVCFVYSISAEKINLTSSVLKYSLPTGYFKASQYSEFLYLFGYLKWNSQSKKEFEPGAIYFTAKADRKRISLKNNWQDSNLILQFNWQFNPISWWNSCQSKILSKNLS